MGDLGTRSPTNPTTYPRQLGVRCSVLTIGSCRRISSGAALGSSSGTTSRHDDGCGDGDGGSRAYVAALSPCR